MSIWKLKLPGRSMRSHLPHMQLMRYSELRPEQGCLERLLLLRLCHQKTHQEPNQV